MKNQNEPVLDVADSATGDSDYTEKNILLATICFALFFTSYMYASVNIALPAISLDFHAHVIDLSWVTSAILVTSAVLLVPFGRLSDIIGLKKMFTIGIFLYVITNTLAALSGSIAMLITMRAIQGIGASMVIGNTFAILSIAFPKHEKGKVLGIAASAVYLGLTCSPLLSGFLTTHFGWRSIFLIIVPAGLIILVVTFWKIKGEWRGSKGESLDLIGTALFGISVVVLMYGFSRLPEIIGWILVPLGLIVMIGFLFWESRIESPLIQIDLFKGNRVFVLSNISALINYAATYAILFFMSLYLQYVKGLSPGAAGFILAVQPAAQAILSPFSGKISDKVEPRVPASLGMGILCICLASFGFLGPNTSLWLIVVTLAILGAGFALFVPPNTNAIMSSVPPKVYGLSSAIMSTMRYFGQMFSMGIAMIALAMVMGSVVVTESNTAEFVVSTRIAFSVFAVLCFIGVFTSMTRGKVR